MNVYRKITLATLVVIAAAVVITPNAHAQILEEKVTVKFSEPVEIPGEVLPAGVYIFEAVENGQHEGRRLPAARHGAGEDVAAFHRGRDRVLLDRGGAGEAHLLDASEEIGVKPEG